MIKFEVFITPSNETHLSVNIFSRVKMQWVYNDQVRINDVLFLLNDLQVTPANALIRMAPETRLYEEFLAKGFEVKVVKVVNKLKINKMESIEIISPREGVKITDIKEDSFTVEYDKAPGPRGEDLIVRYNK